MCDCSVYPDHLSTMFVCFAMGLHLSNRPRNPMNCPFCKKITRRMLSSCHKLYFNSVDSSPNGNAVLVLNTYKLSNKPFIVDFDGKYFSFVFQILILAVKEIRTKIWFLNTARVHQHSLVVELSCRTSSGILVAVITLYIVTNAR